MSLLDGLAAWLNAQGLGVYDPTGDVEVRDWSVFIEHLPQQPDQVIGLWQYAGGESDSVQPWDEVNVQIRLRGTPDPTVSRTRAQDIYDQLHGLGMTSLPDGTWIQLAVCTQGGPIPLGPDLSGRHEHTVNVRIEIEHPSAHRAA